MKVLLDNNIHRRFADVVIEHQFVHVQDLGWHNLQNGSLLRSAEESGFDVFVTADKQMRFQQNLSGFRLVVIVLDVKNLALPEILPFRSPLLAILENVAPGQFHVISSPTS